MNFSILIHAIKISFRSTIIFSNIKTTVTTLLVLPIIELIYNYCLGVGLNSNVLVYSIFASIVLSALLSVAGGVVSAVAADRIRETFVTIALYNKLDFIYWISKILPAFTIAFISGLFFIGGVLVSLNVAGLNLQTTLGYAQNALCALLIALLSGAITGIALSGISVRLSDPYMGSTLASSLLPITAGVIVPVSYYGGFISTICQFIPGTHIMIYLLTSSPVELLAEIAVSVIWASAGLFIISKSISALRQGRQTNLM